MVSAECECSDELLVFLERITDAYSAHDLERLAELVTDDIVFADHRAMSTLDTAGREQGLAILNATFEMLPDFRISVAVLAQDGETYLARDTYDGHAAAADGGGEALMQWWVVDTLRNGRLAREDIYATEDEARAEYARRTGFPQVR